MALQMPVNITPDVLSGFGGGVFDAASGLTVSWDVLGTPYMTAYRVVICANDAGSTQLYSTGKTVLSEPFYGVLPNGNVSPYTVTVSASDLATAGIANGNEYKLYITQWWGATDAESVTQQSASVIQALGVPTVQINQFINPITSRSYTFRGTYTQAQGDGVAWVRWTLYNLGTGTVVDDTGEVYGTSVLQYSYDSFLQGTLYALELQVETQNGQHASSGQQEIAVSYPINTASSIVTATQECGWDGISVNWSKPSSADEVTGYSLYRLDNGTGEFVKVASLQPDQYKLIDYAAKNGHTYTYQLWTEGSGRYLEMPVLSNPVTPCRWNVLLMAAELKQDGAYHPSSIYALSCNVELGGESNNSRNAYEDTFTGYPAYQASSNRYRTGQITAFVGKLDPQRNAYVGDTASYVDEIMALAASGKKLFIRDRKGNFRCVRINGAITSQVQNAYPNQATSVTIPWVETESSDGLNLYLIKGDALWPYDEIVDTTVSIDTETGYLIWTTPDGYVANEDGSSLSIDENGYLVQTLDNNAIQMADLTINQTGYLIARQ